MGSSDERLPPANLSTLVISLATQAMISLGQMPNPVTNKTETNLIHGQHFIDLIAMLEEKTSGNRSDDESKVLEHVQHDLRMAFVRAKG